LGFSNFLECRRLRVNFDVVAVTAWNAEGWLFALCRSGTLVASLVTTLSLVWAGAGRPWTRDIRWASRLERFTVHRAHAVISPSEQCSSSLKASGWLKRRDIHLVPFAVDWTLWETGAPVSETAPTVLFVGRVERRKAPELLVEAISAIRTKVPNAQAVFIGESSGEREGLSYKDWASQRSKGDGGSKFLGSVSRDEIVHWLGKSRVLAMPSISESFGLVAAEAMAAGRPVVITTSSGIAKLVQKGGAGCAIPPGDASALAEALLPFLTDASYAAEVGERARVAARQLLDPATVAEQHEAVYMKAIANSGRQG
jgi:glycosyltransferase involved in cell wall biosynthesis